KPTPGCNGHKATPKPFEVIPDSYLSDLRNVDFKRLQTPASLFFSNTAVEMFSNVARLGEGEPFGLKFAHAYSIKTNPDERLLQLALESGFLAEAISTLE